MGGQTTTPPTPAVVHIDMRSLDCTQVYCRKGWGTRLWVGLKGVLLGILALSLIPGEKTSESLLGIMGAQGQGKPRVGVCKVYHVHNLVAISLGCDMVAF